MGAGQELNLIGQIRQNLFSSQSLDQSKWHSGVGPWAYTLTSTCQKQFTCNFVTLLQKFKNIFEQTMDFRAHQMKIWNNQIRQFYRKFTDFDQLSYIELISVTKCKTNG